MRGEKFELNPYEPCVAKKMIGGKQMTVCWHVDDLKVLYVDHKVVPNFMEWIKGIYGELSFTRGRVHEYLGMMLDFRIPGELQVTMVDYLRGVLEDFP